MLQSTIQSSCSSAGREVVEGWSRQLLEKVAGLADTAFIDGLSEQGTGSAGKWLEAMPDGSRNSLPVA